MSGLTSSIPLAAQAAEIREVGAILPDTSRLPHGFQPIRALLLQQHLVYGRANKLAKGSPFTPGQTVQLPVLLLGKIDLGANHDATA